MTLTAFPAWWFGALLADVYAGRIKVPFLALSPLVLLLPVHGRPAQRPPDHSLAGDRPGPGLHRLDLPSASPSSNAAWRLRALKALKPLGDMSYTLYLIHMPICVFLSGWIMSRSRRPPPARLAMGCFAATLLGVLPLAWLAHLLVKPPSPAPRAATRSPRRPREPPPAPAPEPAPDPATAPALPAEGDRI